MTEPLVSVVIPCFNAERYLAATLNSVFAQTWRSIEVIVVDDGSTDASLAVARSFERTNLTILSQANRGTNGALNTGLAAANGDFVQYLDADDLIDPEKISLQVARLSGTDRCVASAEWGRFYGDPTEVRFEPELVWRDLDPLDWIALSRVDGLDMMFPALWLIPMRLARGVGPWPEHLTLANDPEYFVRVLLAANSVLFCPGARCRYRSGLPNSVSRLRSQAAWKSHFEVNHLCETRVIAREDSPRMRRAFALSWQRLAHAAYPYDPALGNEAMRRARALDPVHIEPDGGTAFRVARRFLGWRLARRLQVASGRR